MMKLRGRKFIFAVAALSLGACQAGQSQKSALEEVKLPSAYSAGANYKSVYARTSLKHDAYSNEDWITAPKIRCAPNAHAECYVMLQAKDAQTIRVFVNYVAPFGKGWKLFYKVEDGQVAFDVKTQDMLTYTNYKEVLTREVVTFRVSRVYLEGARDKGAHLTLIGQYSDANIELPSYYIKAFLDKIKG